MLDYDIEDFNFRDPIKVEKRMERKLQAIKARQAFIKKRNKTYLKGRRGVRLYYDYDKRYDDNDEDADRAADLEYGYDPYEDKHRQVKCVFKQALRREKLFRYLKYLKGRKVLVRDIAWKFAVTKRTIQHDLRWLENGGFITTQKNKTYKGKQTKNSYIVDVDKEKYLPCENAKLKVVIVTKDKDDYFVVLARTNYKPKEDMPKKFIPIKRCYFKIPYTNLKVESRVKHKANLFVKNLFDKDFSKCYKGDVYTNRIIEIVEGLDEDFRDINIKVNVKMIYSLFVLHEQLECPKGYRWVKLSNAHRYFNQTIDNKCVKRVVEALGVK